MAKLKPFPSLYFVAHIINHSSRDSLLYTLKVAMKSSDINQEKATFQDNKI